MTTETGWPKTLSNLPQKYIDAIADFSDERNNGDGYWIYLKEPFFNPQLECRTIHEQKLSAAISILKGCVDKPITREEYFNKHNNQVIAQQDNQVNQQ